MPHCQHGVSQKPLQLRVRFLVAVSRFSMHCARPWPRAVTQERPRKKV
jgi:hypothetical protein